MLYIGGEGPKAQLAPNSPAFAANSIAFDAKKKGLWLRSEWHRRKQTCSNGLSTLMATKSFGCIVTHRYDQKRMEWSRERDKVRWHRVLNDTQGKTSIIGHLAASAVKDRPTLGLHRSAMDEYPKDDDTR